MLDLLPALPQLSAFFLASFILAITPGPGVAYIVMRALTQGRVVALASVAGVALGNLGNAMAAALGLAALFAASSIAFTIVKWVGAAYLIYLGVQILHRGKGANPAAQNASSSRLDTSAQSASPDEGSSGTSAADVKTAPQVLAGTGEISMFRIVIDGALVALFNPKTTLFFAAFLPQFMRPDESAVAQSLLLGALFVGIAALTDTLYAFASGWIAPRLTARPNGGQLGRLALGTTFIGMGLMTALSERPR